MNDSKYLNKALKKIEKKLQWGPAEQWTHQQFVKLSEMISDKTKITISVSSLLRLYGKTKKYKEEYNPQAETKNALALFLGYKHWVDFVNRNKWLHLLAGKLKRKFTIVTILIIVVMIAAGLYIYQNYSDKNLHHKQFEFTFRGENLIGKHTPHTVVIHYDITDVPYDSVFIDFDDRGTVKTRRVKSIYHLPKNKHTITHIYRLNRFYRVKLFAADTVLAQANVMIKTNGWEGFADGNDGHKLLFFDSSQIIRNNGVMDIPLKKIFRAGIDSTEEYRVYFRNIDEFNLDCDNLSFKTRVKARFRKGVIECAHFQVNIIGENGHLFCTFMKPGCAAEVDIQLNEHFIIGDEHDLSQFTRDLEQWSDIEIRTDEQNVFVLFNDEEIFSAAYNKPVGMLKGLRFEFKGYGAVDYLMMHDNNNRYVEEFP